MHNDENYKICELPNNSIDNPLVSICIVTYQHKNYIEKCIESILMQIVNFSVEIIIHDDASTDGTTELIKKYEIEYPNLIRTIVQKENQFSKGLKPMVDIVYPIVNGKYIALCDGDDYWIDANKLQNQVDLISNEKKNYSLCVAKTEIRKNDEIIEICGLDAKMEYSCYDIIKGAPYFHTSTYLFKKKYLQQYLSVIKIVGVGDTSLRYIFSDLGDIVLLDKVVSVYRITGEGIWTNLDKTIQIKNNIKISTSFYKYFKKKYRKYFAIRLKNEFYKLLKLSIHSKSINDIIYSSYNFALILLKLKFFYRYKNFN